MVNKDELQQKTIRNYFQVNDLYAQALEKQLSQNNLAFTGVREPEIPVNENLQAEHQTSLHETDDFDTALKVTDNTQKEVSAYRIEKLFNSCFTQKLISF